ncbi:hypothetical protein ASG43_07990 [Aureimonas sp. Leaf454]|uniref:hypothetical protein n=1 Tax=Aureimonas sp. Leaf454 TaxID=1736381 RepID=UPI0006FE3E07|nr:hypothetical protein [Aureimonas sp. Leaf454]KQT48783.1 hypothetical protein ASG43_07990 [Aureimonas sp. Leaf454]
MQRTIRERKTGAIASYSAYLGVGAATAFILAMTFGAIDAPRDSTRQWMASHDDQPTQIVSAAGQPDAARIR